MANLSGFDSTSFVNMINHYSRHDGDREQDQYRYRNQSIDKSRTHLNYQVGVVRSDPKRFVESAIKSVDTKLRSGKKATNVLSDWVVTLPKNELLNGREKEFFEQVYKHLVNQVKEENVVGAYIHMDEAQPHMHFAFLPIVQSPVMTNNKSKPLKNRDGTVKRDRKGTIRYERVQVMGEDGRPLFKRSFAQSRIYTKGVLKEFHPQLEKALSDHFGFRVGIELEDPGVKQLSRLDQRDYIAAKRTLADLNGKVASGTQRLESVQKRIEERTDATTKREASIEQVRAELRASQARERVLERENRTLHSALSKAQKVFARLVAKVVTSIREAIGLRPIISDRGTPGRSVAYNEHPHDR